MSTVMYCYRVPKQDFWELHAAVRAFYLQHSLLGQMAHGLRLESDALTKWWEQQDSLRQDEVELQLFDEGETWLIRPLERGYLFLNSYQAQGWAVQPVFYDNRSDVPDEQVANAPVADWLGEQIEAGRWLLAPVISLSDCDRIIVSRTATRPPLGS